MNLVDRARNLVLEPRKEWETIAAETHTVQDLYTQYVMILAAIGPVASFVGYSLVGTGGLGGDWRVPLGAGVAHMIVAYALTLGAVYALAVIIDTVAPSFGGEKDFMQAFKLASFAPTASWLAGIFSILPALSILGLLGLYSIYLLYTGLPRLMKVPEDRAVPYLLVVLIAVIVLAVMVAAVSGLAIPARVRGF